MDKFLIRGGQPLKGKIEISGAKNSALPCLAATLLSAETVTLHNVPYVKDLITQRRLLEALVRMARDMGIQTLAEGVESAEEAHACRETGFDLFQGYLFGRPQASQLMRRTGGS